MEYLLREDTYRKNMHEPRVLYCSRGGVESEVELDKIKDEPEG